MSTKQSKKSNATTAAEEEDRKMRKLFVDKLNSSITQDDIYSVFSKHGEIEEVAKYQDRRAPNRYFAFVVYKYAKDCVKATHNPCPIIRGRKCACMLAAIGKQFSGYKFFVDKGLLTEEEKAQQRQQNKRHSKMKKNNSRNRHKSGNGNGNQHKSTKSVANLNTTNVPSFGNDRSHSAIRSNTAFADEAASPHYDNHPSWAAQPYTDSHNSQCSFVTNISETMAMPTQPTQLLPSFQRASKSLHELPQMGQTQQFAYSHNGYPNGLQQTQSYNNRHNYVNNGYGNNNNAQWHYAQYNNGMRRPRAQSQPYQYTNMSAHSMSYSRMPMPAPAPRQTPPQKYSLSPQLQPQSHNTITIVPPMQAMPQMQKRSVSYSNIYAPLRPAPQTHTLAPLQIPAYSNSQSNHRSYQMKKQSIAQRSMPKLPLLSAQPKTERRNIPKHSANPPNMYRSHSARGAKMFDIPCPDLLLDNFSLELPQTPSPPNSPIPPPLLLNTGAKISIEMDSPFMDTLQVPKTYETVEDAKKASDAELETGFIMLEASPTPTATASDEEQ